MSAAAEIIIRRAVTDDAGGIATARNQAILAKAGGFYSAKEIADWASPITPERIERYKAQITSEDLLFFVAECDGQIIGYAILPYRKNELGAIYTIPGPWKGIGGMLLAQAEAQAFALGCSYLNCEAALNAEGFYQRHGFKSIEHTTYTSPQGLKTRCVKMTKQLVP